MPEILENKFGGRGQSLGTMCRAATSSLHSPNLPPVREVSYSPVEIQNPRGPCSTLEACEARRHRRRGPFPLQWSRQEQKTRHGSRK